MRRSRLARIALLSGLFFLVVCPVASAQSNDGATIFAAGGLHKLWNDESSIGTGIAAGGGISATVLERLVLRVRATRSHNKRDFDNGVVFQTAAWRYTGEALWKFSNGPRAAYAGLGAGVFTFDHESVYGPNPHDPAARERLDRFTSSGTEPIWGAIAGLTAASNGRFRLQPEVSMWLSDGYHIVIEGGALVAWSW